MKFRDKYRLQSLFVLREKELERTRRLLAVALEETRACNQRVEKAQKALAKKQEELEKNTFLSKSGSLRVQDLMIREALEKSLKKQVQAAAGALSEELERKEMALKKETVAAASVRMAQGELKVLERHREKWEKEKGKEAEKKADELMEEVAVSWQGDTRSELRKREK